MDVFIENWAQAAYTSLGFFWMALWAFILGYFTSALIQVFVSQKRMHDLMGKNETKGVLLGSFFGFISSSCSFSALATTKSLFQKGASFIASLAFLLASTNLVIELGILIAIFLDWQFVLSEYLGGILLILISWLLIKIIKPKKVIKSAREHLDMQESSMDHASKGSLQERLSSAENWTKVGRKYAMEWKMVWKDISIGFTVAGIIAVYVPEQFFETLFIGSGPEVQSYSFPVLLEHVIVGPIAAFLTFIGSMGNIPLAALLFDHGVSFAGVMAFIFSDLVVFPVLRINAKYYGWKMSLFILFLLFSALIITSLLLHYGLDWLNYLPRLADMSIVEQDHFSLDYSFYLNLAFIMLSAWLIYLGFFKKTMLDHHHMAMAPKGALLEKSLKYLAFLSYIWLGIGILIYLSL